MSTASKQSLGWKNIQRKWIIFAGIGAVVLVGAGICAAVVLSRPIETVAGSVEDDAVAEARLAQVGVDGKLQDESAAALKKGNTAEAAQAYGMAIAQETDVTRKVQLLVDQSAVYYAANRYDEAITIAKQAEVLGEDKFVVADWLSRAYEDQGRYNEAARYYRLAGEWAASPQNQTGLKRQHFETEAARVETLEKQRVVE